MQKSADLLPWPENSICSLFGITHPIVQAGMIWVSGGKLAAAAANSGCLGIVGAGSMKPDILKTQIQKARSLTNRPLGVNVPLLYRDVEAQIQTALDEGIRIFFTSAGSPKRYTQHLKKEGCTVVHVTSSVDLAKKCEEAGVDAVVLEGFEAGGHNGRDELTTLVLLQQARNRLKIPVIAAGGIGSGEAIAAAFAMGAGGVQIGTAFALTRESSAHENFKKACFQAQPNATFLRMKKTVPVRLLENEFARQVARLEEEGATPEQLTLLLGKGRARKGMHEGDIEEGELEIGQVVSEFKEELTCEALIEKLIREYRGAISHLCGR